MKKYEIYEKEERVGVKASKTSPKNLVMRNYAAGVKERTDIEYEGVRKEFCSLPHLEMQVLWSYGRSFCPVMFNK